MEAQDQSLPDYVYDYIEQILEALESRKFHINKTRPRNHLKDDGITYYDKAKRAETEERNLKKALKYYMKSVCHEEKPDSCIKDFASVLHQMGFTSPAIKFLEQTQIYYCGDIKKFERLKQNLINQLQPSVKHHCKSILMELPVTKNVTFNLLEEMFENLSRLREYHVYSSLDFSSTENNGIGKYVILNFESFSAAKKTLEKFKFAEWFGISKFWMKDQEIVCEAEDGKKDFQVQRHYNHEFIEKMLNLQNSIGLLKLKQCNLGYFKKILNILSIKMIQDDIFKISRESITDE